jgi:hypothetical protein
MVSVRRVLAVDVQDAERALVEHAVAISHQRHDARHRPLLDRPPQQPVKSAHARENPPR